MPPHPRLNWEFVAVLKGKLSPYETNPKGAKPLRSHCWLFPPGVVHGWIGERGKTCELMVVHFSSLPPAIEQVAANRGALESKLSPHDLTTLGKMIPPLERHYWSPTVESELRAHRVLVDMCLLLIRDYEERSAPQTSGGNHSRVVKAEEWLRANLTANPSINDAAQQVGLSTSQLCRVFSQIRKETPQDYLNRVKIERAMELLGYTNAKLEQVAVESGFSSASNLCRAFKAARGRSPTDWRTETYIQYRKPPKGADTDYRQHGVRVRPVL